MPEFKLGSHFFYPVKTVLKSGFVFTCRTFSTRNPQPGHIYITAARQNCKSFLKKKCLFCESSVRTGRKFPTARLRSFRLCAYETSDCVCTKLLTVHARNFQNARACPAGHFGSLNDRVFTKIIKLRPAPVKIFPARRQDDRRAANPLSVTSGMSEKYKKKQNYLLFWTIMEYV